MSNLDETSKLLEIVKELSQTETNETELLLAIFKKSINARVQKQVEYLTHEFDEACKNYAKKSDDVYAMKDEIIGGYEKEFYRVKERLEEQYINLIFELQEIQSNQKIAITNYMKIINSDYTSAEDMEMADALIDKYGNYCGLEEECYKMLDESSASVPYLIDTVMKFEYKELVVKERGGSIFAKLKNLFSKMFGANKFDSHYVSVKRAKLEQIKANTDTVIEEIRDNTVNYIDTLASYKEQIKEAANINA